MNIETLWPVAFWALVLLLSYLDNLFEARADKSAAPKRWMANFGLGLTNGALAAIVPVGAVLASQYAATQHVGLGQWLQWPMWLGIIVWAIVHSLTIYGVHRVSHVVPAIWRLHRIHHSDPIIDTSTAFRHHPLELLFNLMVFGSVAIVMGIDPIIVAAFEIFELLFALTSHSSLRLPIALEKSLSWVFVTPALHRVHHSAYEPETNSNYGNSIIIWDRIFATYRVGRMPGQEQIRFGLDEVPSAHARDFGAMLIAPFLAWFKFK